MAVRYRVMIEATDNPVPTFTNHIRLMFRPDPDVVHMNLFPRVPLDLTSYEAVKNNSAAILRRLKGDGVDFMPPAEAGGPWPHEWIALFERWIEAEHPE